MVAPGGMATLAKRTPTCWTSLPSTTNSRSELPLATLPLDACSASSEAALTRTSMLCAPAGRVVDVVLVGTVVVVVDPMVVVVGASVVVVVVVGAWWSSKAGRRGGGRGRRRRRA